MRQTQVVGLQLKLAMPLASDFVAKMATITQPDSVLVNFPLLPDPQRYSAGTFNYYENCSRSVSQLSFVPPPPPLGPFLSPILSLYTETPLAL
jgi:hypothetical protein